MGIFLRDLSPYLRGWGYCLANLFTRPCHGNFNVKVISVKKKLFEAMSSERDDQATSLSFSSHFIVNCVFAIQFHRGIITHYCSTLCLAPLVVFAHAPFERVQRNIRAIGNRKKIERKWVESTINRLQVCLAT